MLKNCLVIDHRITTITLIFIGLFLVLANLACQFSRFVYGHDYLHGLVPLFDMSSEQNIPTFFSTVLMFFIAALLAVITALNSKNKDLYLFQWKILLLGFIYMSYDEAFRAHELWTKPVAEMLGDTDLGFFHYAWTIPAITIVCTLAVFFHRFLMNLPKQLGAKFMISGAIYILGALGLELIEGKYDEVYGNANLTYELLVTVEEALEMLGLIIFISALLNYLSYIYGEIVFYKKIKIHF